MLYVGIAFILGFLVEKERKQHRDLVRAESLAAVGQVVSEVAHDMKTPLMAIGGFAVQVSKKFPQNDSNQKKLEVVIQETARLEAMIREMLDFGRPLELQRAKIDLNELLRESMDVAQAMARKAGVELNADLSLSVPSLLLDAPKVKKVLFNLLTNAIQASPAGECVLVRTCLDKKAVLFEVTDCGCGIEEEDRESVFHPFFSTKKGGTGLGLGIVKKIVDTHGGEASFHPNPEKGVTFTMRFPLSEAKR